MIHSTKDAPKVLKLIVLAHNKSKLSE
ncbi:unnamed protein product, partial [Adineta steineri]